MTHATKAIYRWLLSDFIKVRLVSNILYHMCCFSDVCMILLNCSITLVHMSQLQMIFKIINQKGHASHPSLIPQESNQLICTSAKFHLVFMLYLVLCVHHHHSNIAADQMLYTEKDLEKSMDKIETVNFHQVCVGSSVS